MNTERLEELVWELIDGEITPQDQLLLKEYLFAHPEAEERRRELVALAARLDSEERVEPPAVLRQRIEAALEAMTPPVAARPRLAARMASTTTSTWRLRLIYLAAGLLIGAGLTFVVVARPGQDLERSKLYGSVQARPPLDEPIAVDLEAGAGRLILERRGTRRSLGLDLRRPGPVVVGLELESGSGVIRLESLEHSGSAALEVSTEGPRARLMLTGPASLRITADVGAEDASLAISITAEDAVLGGVSLFSGGFSNES